MPYHKAVVASPTVRLSQSIPVDVWEKWLAAWKQSGEKYMKDWLITTVAAGIEARKAAEKK
ncbi:MAG: hypothetical protein AB1760_00190 [Pseudomonadota bacterium]